jgi:cell division septation protein DedD
MSDKYRIQIFAGTNKAGADDVAGKAKDLAGDEIYIVQEQGLWKVRVGDFETKELAEKALTNWKNQGYSSAWIVEMK